MDEMGVDAKLLDSLLAERKSLCLEQGENRERIKASRELSSQLMEEIDAINGKISDHLYGPIRE